MMFRWLLARMVTILNATKVKTKMHVFVKKCLQKSPFCINEEFRTINGGGDFDPFDNSEGKMKVHAIIEF